MKKVIVILFCLLLFFSIVGTLPLIISEENNQTNTENNLNLNDINFSDIKNPLSTQITIPPSLELPVKIIFGLTSEDKLDFQLLIVLIAIWLFFFLIIHNILGLTPFFEDWKSWAGAIIVTLLISITGSIKSSAIFFFNIGNVFSILEKWGPLKLGFSIVIIIIIYYATNIILGILKETVIVGKSVRDGMIAGAEMAKLKAMHEMENIGKK